MRKFIKSFAIIPLIIVKSSSFMIWLCENEIKGAGFFK